MFPEFVFTAQVWVYQGDSPWHFVTLPPDVSSQIREATAEDRKAFGTLKVAASIGGTRWKTSIFWSNHSAGNPSNKPGCFYMPVKAAVRQREQLHGGLTVEVVVEVLPATASHAKMKKLQ